MTSADASATRRPASTGSGHIEVELAQSLGLAEALTIGIGTMIGAGIFVLPGFIVAKAGPAATLAFALGGFVALLNALAAAEVATGMPKSGGAYYFISRALGPLWGAIIGWGSWFGLIFATAFYAVGFGEYVHHWTGVPVPLLAGGMTLLLVGLNLIGSKAAGSAQNLIVAVLVAVMVLFIGRGVMDADPGLPFAGDGFLSFGLGAIFGGTATLFVTYCGFGEIASMAEEIKNPGRNLPLALIGSVVSVTILYCIVMFLCTMLRPASELTGATIVADLAGDMLGTWGSGAVLLGAVMATVSSANASIMSASRICFAMGRDNMIWPWLNVVHPRFRVPHRAVMVTGVLIIAVLFVGEIELLAEAAGLLHLLMYGLMSLACVILRGAKPMNYRPVYRVPFFPWVPLLGAAGTLAISFFIAPIIVVMGLGIVVFAVLHYRLWAMRRTGVRGAWPSFVRRILLEPAMERVEALGAAPLATTSIVVAVRNPHREHARIEVAAALLGDRKGRIVALSVFPVVAGDTFDDTVLAAYHAMIEERDRALREQSDGIVQSGVKVTSLVPMSATVLPAMLSAVEVSDASIMFLGWPAPHANQPAQFGLVADMARYARSHLMVLRERGPMPPRDVLAFAPPGPNGRLALGVAARLASAWGLKLTAAVRIEEGAPTDAVVDAEAELESRVIEVTRARFRALPAASQEDAVRAAASFHQFVILPAPDGPPEEMIRLMQALEPISGSSLLIVRASEGHSLEPWV